MTDPLHRERLPDTPTPGAKPPDWWPSAMLNLLLAARRLRMLDANLHDRDPDDAWMTVALAHANPMVRAAAARHPRLDPDRLEALGRDPVPGVQAQAWSHPQFPITRLFPTPLTADAIERLPGLLRTTLSRNPAVPRWWVAACVASQSTSLRRLIATAPTLQPDDWDALARHDGGVVDQVLAARQDLPPAFARRWRANTAVGAAIAKHDALSAKEQRAHIAFGHTMRLSLAANPHLAPDVAAIVYEAAKDEGHTATLTALAKNPATPPAIVDQLFAEYAARDDLLTHPHLDASAAFAGMIARGVGLNRDQLGALSRRMSFDEVIGHLPPNVAEDGILEAIDYPRGAWANILLADPRTPLALTHPSLRVLRARGQTSFDLGAVVPMPPHLNTRNGDRTVDLATARPLWREHWHTVWTCSWTHFATRITILLHHLQDPVLRAAVLDDDWLECVAIGLRQAHRETHAAEHPSTAIERHNYQQILGETFHAIADVVARQQSPETARRLANAALLRAIAAPLNDKTGTPALLRHLERVAVRWSMNAATPPRPGPASEDLSSTTQAADATSMTTATPPSIASTPPERGGRPRRVPG